MKSNYIHVCFVVDESGSMYNSTEDVIKGVQKIIDEQRANTNGICKISLYKFSNDVEKCYTFQDVNSIPKFTFRAHDCTALNDGVGTAIDEIGKILADTPEDERPEQNMIVVITDGFENMSKEYTLEQVKDRIKHQEEKYNWKFVYLGVDLMSSEQANKYGFKNQGYSVRSKLRKAYDAINTVVATFRNTTGTTTFKNNVLNNMTTAIMDSLNDEYRVDTGINV